MFSNLINGRLDVVLLLQFLALAFLGTLHRDDDGRSHDLVFEGFLLDELDLILGHVVVLKGFFSLLKSAGLLDRNRGVFKIILTFLRVL